MVQSQRLRPYSDSVRAVAQPTTGERAWIPAALLVFTLAVAGLLRTWQMDLVEFKQDESGWLWLAADLLDKGKLPQIGSVDVATTNTLGMHIPPLMAYVMALPLVFSRDPVLATGFVALLNVAAVGLVYWLTSRCFGAMEGFLASLLLAASPMAVFYSRKIWSNYLLAPFAVLLFLAAYALFVQKRHWALAPAIFLVSWCIQLHPSSAALAVCLATLALAFRHELRWRPALVGLLAGFALWLPYLSFAVQNGGDEFRRALSFFASGKSVIDGEALQRSVELITTGRTEVGASITPPWWMPAYLDFYWFDYLWLGLLAVGLGLVGYRAISPQEAERSRRSYLLLLVWAVVPVLLASRHSISVHRFYLLPVQPALYIVLSLGLAAVVRVLWQRSSFWGARQSALRALWRGALGLLAVGLAAALFSQVYAFVEFLRWAEGGNAVKAFGFPPLRYQIQTANRVSPLVSGDAPVIFVPADKDAPKVFSYLLRDRAPRFEAFTVKDTLAFPLDRGSGVYLIPSSRAEVLREAQALLPEARWTTVRTSGGESQFAVAPASEDVLAQVVPQDLRPASSDLAIGLRLAGWRVLPFDASAHALRGVFLFEVTERPPSGGDYHVFNHILDASGKKVAQRDSPGIPVGEWQLGERRLLSFNLELADDLPPGEYRWLLGAYDLATMQRVPIVDGMTGQTADSVTLGPIILP